MKSERRHDLKQIWLAQKVGDTLQIIQPYWQWIAGVAGILALVVFVITFISNRQRDAQQVGWEKYLEAVAGRNPDALSLVAEDNAGNSVAPWARHAYAQAKLIEASSTIYFDRAAAQKDFLLAVDGFNAVLGQTTEALLRQRAQFGLGQAYEGLNELSDAREQYQQLAETWPDSAIGKQADERLKSLQDSKTKEFYTWFFAQEPPAPNLPELGDFPDLSFGQNPSEPNITLPNSPLNFPLSNDLDIDFETTLDDAADRSDTGILGTLDTDAAETLELDAPETSDADADETALDSDAALDDGTAGSGADTDGAEDSNEN